MDIRQTLRYLGVCIGSKSFFFGDNRSVVTSVTLPHSTLTKHHNILEFHRVREAIAVKLMAFYWIQSAYNLSNIISRHWDHPTMFPLILKLLLQEETFFNPKRSNTRKRERKFKNPTRKSEKERKQRIISGKKTINTQTTRGE